ncbi:hypothetical protein ACIPSE_04355 [Streptomyces sp. NPDC090106]|uniref:hypothetical protein n=1 Tax=Streptomyces sp. NPDC090106 TaxID=3365946 RepID=UPI0037FB5623
MPRHEPPGIIAPHIPADLYRRAEATGQPVVIVVQTTTPTSRPLSAYLYPIVIAGAAVGGIFGLIAAFLALIDFATHTAVSIAGAAGPIGVGGISLKLFGSKRT